MCVCCSPPPPFFPPFVQVVWFLSSLSLQRISAVRTTAGMTLTGDVPKCFCLQNIHRDARGLAEGSCHASSSLEKSPDKSDWNWPVVLLLLTRDRFGGLAHFHVLLSFLQVNSKWLFNIFFWGGGVGGPSKTSQKGSCVV